MYVPDPIYINSVIDCIESFCRFISEQVNIDLSSDECSITLPGQVWLDHTIDIYRASSLLRRIYMKEIDV